MLTIEQAQDCADIHDAIEVVVTVIEQLIEKGEVYTFLQLCERAESHTGEGYIVEFSGRFYNLCVGMRIHEVGNDTIYTIIAYGEDISTNEEANITTQRTRPAVMF